MKPETTNKPTAPVQKPPPAPKQPASQPDREAVQREIERLVQEGKLPW